MKPIWRALCLPLGLSVTMPVAAQVGRGPVIDLSGTWVRVDSVRPSVATVGDAAFQVGDAGSGWGSPLKITQTAERIVVEYQVFSSYDLQPPQQLAFALDGRSSTNTLMVGHTSATLRSTASFTERGGLGIVTLFPAPTVRSLPPGEVRLIQFLRLENPATLVIETARRGLTGTEETTTVTTYTRK